MSDVDLIAMALTTYRQAVSDRDRIQAAIAELNSDKTKTVTAVYNSGLGSVSVELPGGVVLHTFQLQLDAAQAVVTKYEALFAPFVKAIA